MYMLKTRESIFYFSRTEKIKKISQQKNTSRDERYLKINLFLERTVASSKSTWLDEKCREICCCHCLIIHLCCTLRVTVREHDTESLEIVGSSLSWSSGCDERSRGRSGIKVPTNVCRDRIKVCAWCCLRSD